MANQEREQSKNKLVQCEYCPKTFSKISNKNTHMKIKHVGRRFICTECNEVFTTKFTHVRHMKRSHPHVTNPQNIDENEVYVADNIEMTDAAKSALIKRLRKEIEQKDKRIKKYKKKVKKLRARLKNENAAETPSPQQSSNQDEEEPAGIQSSEIPQLSSVMQTTSLEGPSQIESNNQDDQDGSMLLQSSIGLEAWNQWVIVKMFEKEKSSMSAEVVSKIELADLSAEALNNSLSLFVKEVRKPDGTEYAPDTIFYFALSIQMYLIGKQRIDNIFTDPCYEEFSTCLDEIVQKFFTFYANADKTFNIFILSFFHTNCEITRRSHSITHC